MPLSLFRRTGILPNPNRLPVACGQAEHPLSTTGEPAARRSYVKNESVGACPQVTHESVGIAYAPRLVTQHIMGLHPPQEAAQYVQLTHRARQAARRVTQIKARIRTRTAAGDSTHNRPSSATGGGRYVQLAHRARQAARRVTQIKDLDTPS